MYFCQTTRRILLTSTRSPTGVTSLCTAASNHRPNFKPTSIPTSTPYGLLRPLGRPANQIRTKMGDNPAPEAAPFRLTKVDKWVLAQTDDEYTPHTWDELREIIGTVRSGN